MTYSVLVVDDEPNILLSLEFLMTQMGLDVRVASDGETALDAIGQRVPDLVLLDVMLPKCDGYQVCRKIRANPKLDQVKVVMLTAKGKDAEREKGLDAGADDYIIKPFSNREVNDRVKLYLEEKSPACST
ncbi:response regulator transcription factor [Denitrobaculum tricleocarpae]|uniref:Response regulator n=1 Tax=Denitrobaculum tricleocarpae TaxID=2591009 RepID=A0A545TMG2_9PROT|nr:response regulator [Denitrobaculum tricleocarpae]TQV78412.1 response regulator [Denitrobaculum tricleocarpae]